jgi:hypothetical protein
MPPALLDRSRRYGRFGYDLSVKLALHHGSS